MCKYIKKLITVFCVISVSFSNINVNGTKKCEENKQESIKENGNSRITNIVLELTGLIIIGIVVCKIKNKDNRKSITEFKTNVNKNDIKFNLDFKNNANDLKKEENWVKFLSGEKIDDKSFRFNSCEDFRHANDSDLENFHDYVQVVFPNFEKSSYANSDLYLNKNIEKWKKVLSNKEICIKTQENLNLNLIRMLKFWRFEVVVNEENNKITKLVASDDGTPFMNGNHNGLRLTRVLISLKIFGLNDEYELLMKAIEEKHTDKLSYEFWKNTKNTPCLVNLNKF